MRLNLLLLAITLHFGRCLCNEEAEQTKFANSWAVHVDSLDHDSVDKIATKHGFINRGQIGKHHGYYLFERKQQDHRRERRDVDDHTELLMTEPKVNWAEQQRILERSKRNVISSESRTSRDKRDMAVSIQDPFYKDQWYLQNIGQSSGPSGLDINVLPVWGRGFSGQGIVVSILDDGVDHTHPDLRRNYDPNASFDFNDFDTDPSPRTTNPLNRHGTRCAGEIAAEANNGICGVGVSFNASIGGIRMLDGAATDVIEGLSLGYRADYIDIYTCCWGPKDDGKRFGKPGFFASRSLEIGAEKGRGGKGNIFVWATGNGGLTDDDCNCDGYTTSIYTVSIGAISDHGLSTYYTETCASTIAVTFSGASHREADENKIITTDLNHKCTKTFKGTSSAAPLASGMLALVLEANPNLSWRDVQHIIVETSQKTSPLDEGWKRNGAGKIFNHKFGFGKLDTTQMVNAALNWKPVAKHRVCNDSRYDTKRNIPSSGSLILSAETSSCEGSTSEVRKLEHVQVVVSLKHRRRGDLSITLISPSGTRSQLLKTRRNDKSTEGLTDWVFMTVHCWGENPKGSWSLVVTDNDRNTREHHVIKAKQGDMEDVERVVMDDSEKRGNWDSRVVNEYERPKNASLGNETKNDHILKNMEDTTGELVKGNKFVELAKRKKNRKKVAEILKTEKSQTDHARNASKVPKNHQFIKQVTSYRAKVKYWHRKTKHMKRFWNRHNKGRKWNRKHRKMKSHREKLLEKAKHKTYTKKASKNNTKKLLIANTKMSSKKQWSLSKVKDKPTNLNQDKQLKTSMPVGRLESSTTTASATKSDLQAIASPLIQKIIGISRTANFVSAQNHQSLVGEVNIKMKLFGNGIKQKDTKAADHADSSRSSVQYEHRKHQQNPSDASLPVDIYAKLLRSVESMRRNSSESDLAKEQQLTRGPMVTKGYSNESVPSESHLNETSSLQSSSTEKTHPGSSFSVSRLNGTESTSEETGKEPMPTDKDEENSADINHKPFIFYDNDSKKYVALGKTDASKNVNSFVIVGEGSGSGSGNQDKPEKSSDINEKKCGESQDGNCEDDYYRNIDLEESDEDAPFKKLLKDQNTTKQPEDDFGDVDKFKLSKIELYPPEEESKGFGKIDGMSHIDGSESGDLPENGDFSESKELDSGNKMTGNDVMNNYTTGNDETGTGNPITENIDNDMHDYSRKEYQSGRKLSGGNGKYQSEDSSLRYNNDTQKLEEQTKPPTTGSRISKTGSESIGSENINTKANDINIARDENTRTGIKNAEKVDGNAEAAKANAQEVDERPGTEIARTEKAVTGRASARKVNGNSRTAKASSENANDKDPLNWGLSDSEAANLDLENNESKNETSAIHSAKETDQENKINDDFGDMGSGDYQDLELRKRYQKLRNATNDIFPTNSSSFEEMIKKRLEEEYGVDNTSTSENIESSIPKNDSFEGERIEHENQVTDDVSSSDFSGNEIPGSGNGKNTEYEIIDLADVKDDIGGYVGESQNHSVNSSAENNFASGDGKQEPEQQNVTQQRVTEKSMSEEKVPIDVSLNKSKDTNPEGSTPDQGQDLSGPIPNKVHVDNDAPTIYEPAAEEKDTMNEAEPTKEEVKQPEQLNKDAAPVYLDEAPKDGAPIESNGDPEQIGNDYQESENDDSEKQEQTLEAMRTENSKKIENQEKPEDGFLQRVKEDIKQKKIGDLEKLEKVLKRRMSKAMHGLSDEDSNAILKAVMSEKLPEDSDSQRLVRRGLAKAPSKANDQVNQLTNEPSINKSKQEHSGILESWSLIFYGT